jgi:hypothetical protein
MGFTEVVTNLCCCCSIKIGGYIVGITRIIAHVFYISIGIFFLTASEKFLDRDLPEMVIATDGPIESVEDFSKIHVYTREDCWRFGEGKKIIIEKVFFNKIIFIELYKMGVVWCSYYSIFLVISIVYLVGLTMVKKSKIQIIFF